MSSSFFSFSFSFSYSFALFERTINLLSSAAAISNISRKSYTAYSKRKRAKHAQLDNHWFVLVRLSIVVLLNSRKQQQQQQHLIQHHSSQLNPRTSSSLCEGSLLPLAVVNNCSVSNFWPNFPELTSYVSDLLSVNTLRY